MGDLVWVVEVGKWVLGLFISIPVVVGIIRLRRQ